MPSNLKEHLTGLEHLAGKQVSVLADGAVKSSPFDPDYIAGKQIGANTELKYEILTVKKDGTLTLPKPASIVHVGLPYIWTVETLDINNQYSKRYNVNSVTAFVDSTRGVWFGRLTEDEIAVGGLTSEMVKELKLKLEAKTLTAKDLEDLKDKVKQDKIDDLKLKLSDGTLKAVDLESLQATLFMSDNQWNLAILGYTDKQKAIGPLFHRYPSKTVRGGGKTEVRTGPIEQPIQKQWRDNARVALRGVDPLPFHLIALDTDADIPTQRSV